MENINLSRRAVTSPSTMVRPMDFMSSICSAFAGVRAESWKGRSRPAWRSHTQSSDQHVLPTPERPVAADIVAGEDRRKSLRFSDVKWVR